MNDSLFGRLLGWDCLDKRYSLLALAVFTLALMTWYPIFTGEVGWRWGGFVEISSVQARVISGLITFAVVRILYALRFWLFLRILSGDRRSHNEIKELIILAIGFCVGYWVVPALVWLANFVLSLLHNGFVFAVILSAPATVSICAIQLIRYLHPNCSRRPRAGSKAGGSGG